MSGSKNSVAHEKIIASFFIWRILQKQRSWNYNIHFLENSEDNFFAKYLPSAGNSAAVESGVKKLILSAEQKEDYEKNVSQEVKEKLKIYFVKNVEELEKLFWAGEFS